MGTEKKDFPTWFVQNKHLIKEKFEEIKTDVLKEELKNVQIKCTVITKKRDLTYKKHDQDNQTKLIQEYLQAVEEVKNKKKLPHEEKLKKLLPPLVSLSKIVFPSNYASHLPFINEDINLKNDLDWGNLKENPKKYFIVKDTELREFGVLRASNKNIHLSEQYLAYLSFCRFCKSKQVKFISEDKFYSEIYPNAKRKDHRSVDDTKNSMEELIEPGTNCYSLNDIYEDWLLTLTLEKMKSNDRLDRILVTFTIKRALNGDEKAIDKLCSLYQNTAEAKAVKSAARRGLQKDIKVIKREIKPLLKHTISGYSPSKILKHVTKKSGGEFFGIPLCVKLFYVYWLLKVVPERLSKIIENPTIALKDPFEILVLINPISYIDATTDWKPLGKLIQNINKVDSTSSSTKTKRRFKFNSFSFRPSNKTNLYTWLFGTKRNLMKGRFSQIIKEMLNKYQTDKKNIATSSKTDNEKDTKLKLENKVVANTTLTTDEIKEMIEKIKTILKTHRVSDRDIDITIRRIRDRVSYAKIAKRYKITRERVYQIRKRNSCFLRKHEIEISEYL